MQKIRKPCILIVILVILLSSILPIFFSIPVSGSSMSTLYFRDYLNVDNSNPLDSTGMIPLLSEHAPSSSNNSYYPPQIFNGLSINQEEYLLWTSYWALAFLDEIGGEEIPADWGDLLGGYEILLPHPLRIVEAYENQGEKTLEINGNVEFHLDFFSDISARLNNEDQVKVSLYSMNPISMIPSLINTTTVDIDQSLLSNIKSQHITLEDIDVELQPGNSILCAIEIVPGNRPLISMFLKEDSILSSLLSPLVDISLNIMSNIDKPTVQDAVFIINELQNLSSELNISKSDFIEVANGLVCPSLVYDSVDHAASVILPFSSSQDDNSKTYYLEDDNVLSENIPSGEYGSDSLKDTALIWTSESFSRSKIVQSADVSLYILYKDFYPLPGNMELKFSLLFDSTEVANKIISLEKFKSLSSGPSLFHISFDNLAQDTELEYGEKISIQIQFANGSSIGQGILKSIDVLYGGTEYKSSLSLSLSETDHISVTNTSMPSNALIIPGDTVIYTLNISCAKQDDLTIQKKSSQNEGDFWDVNIYPSSLSFEANEKKTVEVTLTSTKYSLKAYEPDPLKVEIEIFGKTGYVTTILQSNVSEKAVTYSTHVSSPQKQEIKKGTNHTYTFYITNNNTGLWPNSFIFTATSAHNLSLDVDPLTFNDLGVFNTTSVNVTVTVPKNIDITSDILTFKVISKENGAEVIRTINSSIIGAKGNADFFGFFESLAKDLGLEESFGDFAPFVIPVLLIIMIFILLILMVFIFTSHSIKVSCVVKKKEILPNESATYPIRIKNRSSKSQTIDIDVSLLSNHEKWNVQYDESPFVLHPKTSKTFTIQVLPSDEIEPEDLAQVEVTIGTLHQKKPMTISLETMIKNGVSDLSIHDISHWPQLFRPHEKVSTSFKLWNHGSVQTKQVKIKMLINGKEKNKVEDIIIPACGYAEIHIPWIAEKGKNNISLIVT